MTNQLRGRAVSRGVSFFALLVGLKAVVLGQALSGPAIQIRPVPGGFIESTWPASGQAYELEMAHTLPAVDWVPVDMEPILMDGLYSVRVAFADEARFFRLRAVEFELDCEREGYPCSLADADPDALAKVYVLMGELWNVRDTGTMADVLNYLKDHPDVVWAHGNDHFVRFLVDGAPPSIFYDVTVTRAQSTATGNTREGQLTLPITARDVVGEDSTGDGAVDNRDAKRALVLAPFLWDFAPDDESADLAARLESLEGYDGKVVYKANPNPDDANITIEDWLALGNYDVVAISTHGSRDCDILPDLSNRCEIWVSSGVAYDFLNPPQVGIRGGQVSGYYDDEDMVAQTVGRLALSLDFFRSYYGGGLDNQLFSLSACETGNVEGAALAAAIGGDNFVMTGWTEVVDSDTAFATALAFYEELGKGLTTSEAFDNIADLGLFPVINSNGIETSFEMFSPGNRAIRIIELPHLIYENAVMKKGVNLAGFVTGRIDDTNPDRLKLTVQIDGVTEEEKSNFIVRYRVNDRDVPGSYNLATATRLSGFEYRYEVVHDLELGFPLSSGPLPLEVIVDLPEGGDSRFFVEASLDATLNLDLGWHAGSSTFDPALAPDVDDRQSAYASKPLFPQPGDLLTPPDSWSNGSHQSVSSNLGSTYVESVRDDTGVMHDISLTSSSQIEAELTSNDSGSAAMSMTWSTNAECKAIPNSANGVECSDARADFSWNPVFWIEVKEEVSYEVRFTLSCSGGGPEGVYIVRGETSMYRHRGGSATGSFPNGGTGDPLYIDALNPFDAPEPPPVNYPIGASDFVSVPGDDPIDVTAVFKLKGPTDPEKPDIVALVIRVSSFSLNPVNPFEVSDPVPGNYGQTGSVTSSVSVKPVAP